MFDGYSGRRGKAGMPSIFANRKGIQSTRLWCRVAAERSCEKQRASKWECGSERPPLVQAVRRPRRRQGSDKAWEEDDQGRGRGGG